MGDVFGAWKIQAILTKFQWQDLKGEEKLGDLYLDIMTHIKIRLKEIVQKGVYWFRLAH
jgi:hypothetical protein